MRGDRKLESGDEVQFGKSRFLFVYDLSELPGLPETACAGASKKRSRSRGERPRPSFFRDRRPKDDTLTRSPTRRLSDRSRILYRLALDMGSAKSLDGPGRSGFDWIVRRRAGGERRRDGSEAGRELELLAHRSRDGKVRTYHKSSQLVSSAVLDSGEAILADNVLNDPQYSTRDSIRDLRAGSLICVPVVEDEHVVGLIHLYTAAQEPLQRRRSGLCTSPSAGRWLAPGHNFAGRTS